MAPGKQRLVWPLFQRSPSTSQGFTLYNMHCPHCSVHTLCSALIVHCVLLHILGVMPSVTSHLGPRNQAVKRHWNSGFGGRLGPLASWRQVTVRRRVSPSVQTWRNSSMFLLLHSSRATLSKVLKSTTVTQPYLTLPVSGISDSCIESIVQNRDEKFNLNTSGLFACDVRIFDVVTRTILDEIGIPLEANLEIHLYCLRPFNFKILHICIYSEVLPPILSSLGN